MKQIIESQEDDEEPEEISKPLVTEKPPQTPTSSTSLLRDEASSTQSFPAFSVCLAKEEY